MQNLKWSYKLNSPYVKSLAESVQHTMRNERAIINAIIKAALDRGYFLKSFDGDGDGSPITKQKALIEPNLYSCDDAHLLILEPSPTEPGKYRKVVSFYFIYGNGNDGLDVVSDGSWVEDAERNTNEIWEALDAAGSAVAAKRERY